MIFHVPIIFLIKIDCGVIRNSQVNGDEFYEDRVEFKSLWIELRFEQVLLWGLDKFRR